MNQTEENGKKLPKFQPDFDLFHQFGLNYCLSEQAPQVSEIRSTPLILSPPLINISEIFAFNPPCFHPTH